MCFMNYDVITLCLLCNKQNVKTKTFENCMANIVAALSWGRKKKNCSIIKLKRMWKAGSAAIERMPTLLNDSLLFVLFWYVCVRGIPQICFSFIFLPHKHTHTHNIRMCQYLRSNMCAVTAMTLTTTIHSIPSATLINGISPQRDSYMYNIYFPCIVSCVRPWGQIPLTQRKFHSISLLQLSNLTRVCVAMQ